jgi:DNA-binding transcriptional regulator GbsR (MarR family)
MSRDANTDKSTVAVWRWESESQPRAVAWPEEIALPRPSERFCFALLFQKNLKLPNHSNEMAVRSKTRATPAAFQGKPDEGGNDGKGCQLSEVQLEIIDICVQGARAFGVSRSLGEIFGLMFCSRRPLNFDDVVRSLGLSSGSASLGLRRMCRLGVIRSCYVARDRRVYYVLETSLRSLAIALLQENIMVQLSLAEQQIQRLRTRLNDDSEASLHLAPRVDLLANWNAQFRGALKPLLEALA